MLYELLTFHSFTSIYWILLRRFKTFPRQHVELIVDSLYDIC